MKWISIVQIYDVKECLESLVWLELGGLQGCLRLNVEIVSTTKEQLTFSFFSQNLFKSWTIRVSRSKENSTMIVWNWSKVVHSGMCKSFRLFQTRSKKVLGTSFLFPIRKWITLVIIRRFSNHSPSFTLCKFNGIFKSRRRSWSPHIISWFHKITK